MPNGGQSAIKPPLNRRIKFGIGATVVTLVILVYPGQMALPLNALFPLMPRMGGCANFAAPFVFIAFLVLALVLSGILIGIGVIGIVLTALRKRTGLVAAALLNATVVSLLLMSPLAYSTSADPGAFSLYVLLDVCALVPATALVLLLSPTMFSSWWHSRVPFVATAVAAGLLLLPGAAGAVAFGFDVRDLSAPQPASTQPASSVSSRAPC
jgi:hypothetical protein